MANQFCRHLSNSYRFSLRNNVLQYQPCCWVPFMLPVSSKEQLVNAQVQATNTVQTNLLKNCNECLSRERTKYRHSGRQIGFHYIPKDAVTGDAYTLELQIDSNCNAACSICGPELSTLWQKQLSIPIHTDFQEPHDQIISMVDFSKLTLVKIFGGEPLFSNSHLKILKEIPDPSIVDIAYSTNGSIFPTQEVFDVWKQFKNVKLAFSIDDLDDRFKYIRWPLKWSMVENNLIRISKMLPNISLVVHTTVNPMNVLYLKELEDRLDVIRSQENIEIENNFSPCFGTWGIDATPPGMRDSVIAMYPPEHPIIGILKSHKEIFGKYKTLESDMDHLDSVRNLNWRATFNVAANYFN